MKRRWHFRRSSSSIVQHGVRKPHVSYCMTTDQTKVLLCMAGPRWRTVI